MSNVFKTTLLLGALTLLLMFFGNAVGGEQGMMTALIFACVMNFVSYWFSDKLVLSMYRARPLTEQEAPEIHQIVRELAAEARIPVPKIYMIPSAAPNAFATGRDPQHAAVAVTQGIFELLNYEELKGVLGHELSHVTNRDILVSTVAATLAGAISMLANTARWAMMFGGMSRRDDEDRRDMNPVMILILAALMPVAAMLIQLAVSRSREYGADESGAHLCGNPLYLASALRKLEAGSKQVAMNADPSSAHLFIVNPLRPGAITGLFSTHPPIEERIARLEKMART